MEKFQVGDIVELDFDDYSLVEVEIIHVPEFENDLWVFKHKDGSIFSKNVSHKNFKGMNLVRKSQDK